MEAMRRDSTNIPTPAGRREAFERLWTAGFRVWDDLWDAFRAGRSPFDALRGYRQKVLFAVSEGNASDPEHSLWLDCLDQSRSALRAKGCPLLPRIAQTERSLAFSSVPRSRKPCTLTSRPQAFPLTYTTLRSSAPLYHGEIPPVDVAGAAG